MASERQVLTFRTRAWLSFAPSTCRMPLGQASGFSRAGPGGRVTPRFRHRLIRFRHFINGSLALASLNLACRDHVPAFPQRSPPSLLTTAARGGLRPAPDCRPRRALLHLSYSSAPFYARRVRDTRPSAAIAIATKPTPRHQLSCSRLVSIAAIRLGEVLEIALIRTVYLELKGTRWVCRVPKAGRDAEGRRRRKAWPILR